jgi:hypothetical protein
MRLLLSILILFTSLQLFSQSPNNALDFDHNDDYVQTSFSGISGSKARTVEAWIKTPFVSGQEVITDWGTASTGGRFTFALINGKLRVEVHGSGVTSSTVVSDTQWHHVAVTFDPNAKPNYRTYVDGKLDSAFNISTAINTGTSINMRIGVRVDMAKFFSGSIDQVRVWNKARTQAQLDSTRKKELCSGKPGLVAQYRFNHGKAGGSNSGVTTLKDFTSNKNNGTLNNFNLSGSSSNWVSGAPIKRAPDTDSSFKVESCAKYITPGGLLITKSQIVTETIKNKAGCDSNLTIDVTIKDNSTSFNTISACDSFTSPSGLNTWYKSGTYTETFTNSVGCDSIEHFYLTINNAKSEQVYLSACNFLVSPSGRHTWKSSGTYYDTLQTVAKCDSILVVDLEIYQPSSITINDSACSIYTGPSSQSWTQSGTYYDTLTNVKGCDSFMTFNIIIYSPDTTYRNISGCDSAVSESGMNVWYNSGIYTEWFLNENGCDSNVHYTVKILKATSSIMNITACDSFTSPSGDVYHSSGAYKDTIANVAGCDSVITIALTLIKNNPTIVQNGDTLEAKPDFITTFKWLNCDNNMSPIPNAVNKKFVPVVAGNYAVAVQQNDCWDTSSCYQFTGLSLNDVELGISIYPNPVQDILHIDSEHGTGSYEITNLQGHKLLEGSLELETTVDVSKLAPGTFIISVTIKDRLAHYKFSTIR